MRVSTKKAALGCVFIIMGFVGVRAWGSSGFDYSGERWHDEELPVPYYVYTGEDPPKAVPVMTFVNAVRVAFQKWEDVSSSYMSFTYRGETAAYRPDTLDGRNVVGWSDNMGQALAYNVYWTMGTYLVESDILLNKTKSWSAATPIPLTAFDLHTALVHEAGHILSLNDVYDPAYSDQVMYYAVSNGAMRRELGEGDIAGITFIYPRQGDLKVSEVRGPSSALEHERIELTAKVENVGGYATTSCRLEFYLSFDSRVDAKDTLLGEDVIPWLKAGQVHEVVVTISLPGVMAEHDHYVLAFADAHGEIQEASEENNTNSYFPLKIKLDSDADGLPNWWEIEMALDPYDGTGANGPGGDPDGEGLANSEEYEKGTNPRLADTDGDGQSDRQEVVAGTDPTDETSVFKVTYVFVDGDGSDRWLTISWQTIAGRTYQVYYQEGLGSEWIPLGPPHDGTGGPVGHADAEGLAVPARYYRVGVE